MCVCVRRRVGVRRDGDWNIREVTHICVETCASLDNCEVRTDKKGDSLRATQSGTQDILFFLLVWFHTGAVTVMRCLKLNCLNDIPIQIPLILKQYSTKKKNLK